MVQEERWNALSPEQSQIVALTAQISKLKDSRVNLGKSSQNKKKGNNKDDKAKGQDEQKSGGKRRNRKNRRKGKNDDKWAWKKVPPKDDEKHEKVHNGTTYYWCHDHGMWTLTKHTEETCYLKQKKNKGRVCQRRP